MKFSLGIALSPLDQLIDLARTAEECGFASIALPDSLFYSEEVSAKYPYTPDGSRFWTAETPWSDPLVTAASAAAVTIGSAHGVSAVQKRRPSGVYG